MDRDGDGWKETLFGFVTVMAFVLALGWWVMEWILP